MNFVRYFSIIILLSFASNFSYGQEEKATQKVYGGAGYFMPGVQILSIGNLNSKLESKGYPKISTSFTSAGGGGHAIIANFIVGGEGHGIIGKDVTNEKYTLNLGGGYGIFDLGYVIFSKWGLNLYPIVGIGGSGLTLSITERTIPTFDDILENPKGHIEMSTGALLLHFAIGADYIVSFGGNEAKGGVLIGLRAGFTYTPVAGDWKMADVKVSGGPETGVNGVYIRLMIGGGGLGKREK